MAQWNELLTDDEEPTNERVKAAASHGPSIKQKTRARSASVSSAEGSSRIPSTSALTYSFEPIPAALHESFKYIHTSTRGLTLVGDRLVMSLVFVEWRPNRTLGDHEYAWQCWKMMNRADPVVEWHSTAYVAEQPEKE
jgi:hypothetical protein